MKENLFVQSEIKSRDILLSTKGCTCCNYQKVNDLQYPTVDTSFNYSANESSILTDSTPMANSTNVITGSSADDVIQVQDNGYSVFGGAGNDVINVFEGTGHSIFGGVGNDKIRDYGNGDNILNGGAGADTYYAQGTGTHTIYIDNINDSIQYVRGTTNLIISVDNYNIPKGINYGTIEYVEGTNELVYFIDAVDGSSRYGFFTDKEVFSGYGEGITIKYSFATQATDSEKNFTTFSTQQQKDIKIALKEFSDVANINFVYIQDSEAADFNFYFDDLTSAGYDSAAGYAYYGGDVHINSRLFADNELAFSNTDDFHGQFSDPGKAYDVLLHEVGHTLGFKHTGNYGSTSASYSRELPSEEENKNFSVMSYNYGDNYDWTSFGLSDFDLATLHYKFGVNESARSGNNRYDMTNTMYVWDGNGIDTITAQNATSGVMVDLAPGSWNYVGTKAELLSADGQSFLGFDSHIENALGSNFTDTIKGNTLNNIIKGHAGHDKLYGNNGNDKLYGGNGNDNLQGGEGNDSLYGDVGKDKLYGGNGNDRLDGGGYDDVLSGQDGDDKLYGGNGNDNLYGGNQHDYLSSGNGNDKLYGGSGNDKLYGGNGTDYLNGGSFHDYLKGGDGEDKLIGGSGKDQLYGGNQSDILIGGTGRDYLNGGTGSDSLNGGIGQDTLKGGSGHDIFEYNSIKDSTISFKDVIMDFTRGEDKIDLSGIDANTSASGNQAFTSIIGANQGFSQAGQLKVKNGVLYGNNDADAQADFAIEVKDVSRLYLGDFVL